MKLSKRITNPEQMRVLFQQRLPGYAQALHITRCKILRIQYRTDLNTDSSRFGIFTMHYQLDVSDLSSQHQGVQLLFAKVFPKGHSQEAFQKISVDHLIQPPFGEALVLLPELEMIIWAFPNDARLHHFPKLISPASVKSCIPYASLPPGSDVSENTGDVNVNVIRYHPEDRCTFRLGLKTNDPKSEKAFTLYGKTFHDDQGMALYRLTHSIWTMSTKTPDSFIISQPLTYDKTLKTLWQIGLSGTPLRDIIDLENCKGYLQAVAKGLASLHKSDLSQFIRDGTFDQLDNILEKIDTVIRELPQLSQQLQSIVSDVKSNLPCLRKFSDRPVHGSFRIKESLVCEKGLAVFDFDKVSMGDWVRDLALFLVDLHLIYHDAALLRLMSASFFQAYRAEVAWDIPVNRLKWHIRVQYLKKIYWIYKNKRLDLRLEARIQKVVLLIQQGIDFDPLPKKDRAKIV